MFRSRDEAQDRGNARAFLEPCGRFGRRYRYDPVLDKRLKTFTTVLLWLGVAAAALILYRYSLSSLTAAQAVEAFPIVLISFDFVRIFGTRQIFRHARLWSDDDADRSLLGGHQIMGGGGLMTSGGLTITWLILDMLSLAVGWGLLIFDEELELRGIIVVAIIFHVVFYASAAGDEFWRRRG